MEAIHPGSLPAKKAKRKVYKKRLMRRYPGKPLKDMAIQGFQLFDGYRWTIPPKIKASESVRWKFSMFETLPQKDTLSRINLNIRTVKSQFVFSLPMQHTGVNGTYSWISMTFQIEKPASYVSSPETTKWLNAYWSRQENEWRRVKYIYMLLFKLKRNIRALVRNYRVRRCIKNVKNVEDVVTMDVPRKPVRLIDLTNRCSYVYEASTIRRLIENRILLSDYMFSNPMPPLNPLTNLNLTPGQLISVIQQCKMYGQYSWILDGLLKYEGDVKLFASFFKQPLKIQAIENHFKGQSYIYKEEVVDFFDTTSSEFGLPRSYVDKFYELITNNPENKYVRQWVHVTKAWYVASELHDHAQLLINARLVNYLMVNVKKNFDIC